MTCLFCKHGETHPGAATVMLDRDETIVVFKGVPADVCENCGEYYLSREIAAVLLRKAEEAVESGAEIQVRRFAA